MRDYYKNTIFDIIKTHLNIIYHNSYFTINEIIKKLKSIFEIYNKFIKSNAEFHNSNFDMNVKDKKKFFEIFYARFNTIIASLNYINILKMFNLKRLINTRLKYRIFNKSFISFRDIIVRLRYIIADLKIINNTFSNKDNKFKGDQKTIEEFAKLLIRNNNFFFDKEKSNNRLDNFK